MPEIVYCLNHYHVTLSFSEKDETSPFLSVPSKVATNIDLYHLWYYTFPYLVKCAILCCRFTCSCVLGVFLHILII